MECLVLFLLFGFNQLVYGQSSELDGILLNSIIIMHDAEIESSSFLVRLSLRAQTLYGPRIL